VNLLFPLHPYIAIFLYFCIFALGLAVGSFINVVSRRLLRGEAITGRSHCESCGKEIAWFDLVPLLSFFLLRSRCRYCRAKLSWQYPLIELVTGVLFVGLFLKQLAISNQQLTSQLFLPFCCLLSVASCLVIIFVTDLLERRVFDVVVWVGVASAFFYRVLFLSAGHSLPAILSDLLLAAAVFLFFWFLRLVTRGRGMGEGDPLLGFLVTLLVGFPLGLAVLFLAFVVGAVVGLGLILFGKKKFGEQIPLGPFLALGALVVLFWGDALWAWYLSFLGL